jgi:putative PIN family toxin of toxin-antitoxin system
MKSSVVVDTGVLVSAFAFWGVPEQAVIKSFREYNIIVSPELLREYRDVPLTLKLKRKIDDDQLRLLLSGIAAFVSKARIAYPREKLFICRDIKDNMLLECCKEGHARFLITGDEDLLGISEIPFPLSILSPAQFVKI